ncbi:hypothetical protein [Gordonia sp. (in: high G+C Gram-positive bacteria)]|uniref:hypothetical protein n=1 Tax=Gordonia sp. (in: high G+C Gram-positive bacteria) TaxID=84139 RepID=UPI003F999B55
MTLRTWNLRVGVVVFIWLSALLGVALAGDAVTGRPWLIIHLLGLGAASNAILIWSWYFTEAVLRLSHSDHRILHAARLTMFNVGAGTVVVSYGVISVREGEVSAGLWSAVLAGAVVAFAAIAWHSIALLCRVRAALSARFAVMVHFYVAAGVALLVGIGFGAASARGDLPGDWPARLAVAHSTLNVFGWVGLTVIGTLVTFWPTILRTRMAVGVEEAAARGLPLLCSSIAVTVVGALIGVQSVAAIGLAVYAAALAYVVWAHADEVRRKPPTSFAGLSVLAGVIWLLVALVVGAVAYFTAPDWIAVHDRLNDLTTALLGGFLAQVLLGALSYLVPVVLGRKPSATQAGTRMLDIAGPARVGAANAGLLVWTLPGSGWPHTLSAAVAVVALGSFIPLVIWATVASSRRQIAARPRATARPSGVVLGSMAAGVAAVVVAAAVGVAVDPAAVGLPARSDGAPPLRPGRPLAYKSALPACGSHRGASRFRAATGW